MFSLRIVLLFFFAIVKNNLGDDLFPSNCGREQMSSRIVGGTEVTDNKYPWVAFIRMRDENGEEKDLCGGVVLNKKFILTAAHCVYHKRFTNTVILGKTNIKDNDVVELEIEEIIEHKQFDSQLWTNDIALLKMKKDIEFSDKIQPICLPDKKKRIAGDLIAVGWGKTSHNSIFSSVLREVTIREYKWEYCNNENDGTLKSSQICAGEIGKDTCDGDSGGPLMMKIEGRMTVVGITSFGERICGSKRNSVYTRVTSFLSWIKRNMKL